MQRCTGKLLHLRFAFQSITIAAYKGLSSNLLPLYFVNRQKATHICCKNFHWGMIDRMAKKLS